MTQLRLLVFGLLIQSRIWIGRALAYLVRSLFALEINGRISRIISRIAASVSLFLETLLSRPHLNQGAVHSEMLVGQQSLCPIMNQDSIKGGSGNISIEKAIPVLAENRGVPNSVIHAESDKPAEQSVLCRLFATWAQTSVPVSDHHR